MPGRSTLLPLAALALAVPLQLAAQQPGRAAATAGRIELVRELAIGSDTGELDYEFGTIGSTAASRSGSVYVTDYHGVVPQIRKYDASGRYRGAVGRPGAGPGEYRSVDGMALVGGSVLLVYDRLNGRVTLFDTAGVYRSSFRMSGFMFGHNYFVAFSDGTIGVRRLVPAADGETGLMRSVFVRYRLNGSVVDSMAVPPERMGGMQMRGPSVGTRWPFDMTTVFAVLPGGGIATAHTSRYRVEVVPAGGRPFTIERDARPIPLEGGEREEWEALVGQVNAAARPDRRVTIPREKPIIRDLFADAEGRIWVDLYTKGTRAAGAATVRRPTLFWSEHNAYDVFDERGGYLGRIDLAPSSRLVAVLGNRVWVSEQTEDGFYVLVRYRMSPPEAR